jgi:sugar (glycoside-pentoside-hexuronide) transporter
MDKAFSSDERLFRKNKWFYSLGGIGRDMAYSLFASFLLLYVMYTRELTSAQFAAIGVIMAICRVWDGINDPVMGGIIENTRSRFGKFKPWIIIGAVTNAAVLVVLFSNRVKGWGFVVLFTFLYLIWDITFTMNDIGYWSMLPSLTSEPRQRDSITSLANLFAGIGAIVATGLIPIFTNGEMAIGGNSITGYAAVSAIIAAIFVLCQLMTSLCVRERAVSQREKEEHIGLKKMAKVIVKNDQLMWVTLIMLLYNLGSSFLTAFGVNYIYLEKGYNGSLVTMFVAFYAVASVLINALYPKFAEKLSRNRLAAIALGVTVAGYALFFFNEILFPMSMAILCAEAFIISAGQSLFYMVVTICLTNTIEYNEYKTGSRDEAIIFSLRPFMAKMSSALEQVVLTLVYIAIGMTVITNQITDYENQANMGKITEEAKTAGIANVLNEAPSSTAFWLKVFIVVLPVVLIAIAYFVMRKKTKIDEKEYSRMLAEIKARKENA